MTVAITLVAPPPSGSPVTVRVVLDTHSVGLDGVAFERAVALRMLDGSDQAPAAVEQLSGTGHHREAVVVFRVIEGATDAQIVVRDVGGIPERVFAWEVPVARWGGEVVRESSGREGSDAGRVNRNTPGGR